MCGTTQRRPRLCARARGSASNCSTYTHSLSYSLYTYTHARMLSCKHIHINTYARGTRRHTWTQECIVATIIFCVCMYSTMDVHVYRCMYASTYVYMNVCTRTSSHTKTDAHAHMHTCAVHTRIHSTPDNVP